MAFCVFENPGKRFILFDREVNRLVPITEETAHDLTGENGEERRRLQLETLRQKGLCRSTVLHTIEHPSLPFMETFLETQVDDMVLQVTQNCNLRCEYCAYSGKYYNRTHSSRRMSFQLARDAVDFLVAHSRDKDHVNIGFYGGEPLLELDLIKKVIQYIEDTYPGKEFNYTITTNGTLLDDETVCYLESKKVNLTISLDGPKETHDKYRRFVNGNGSFEKVMDNLRQIARNHPYYYKLLRTNTVFTPGQNYEEITEFLDHDPDLQGVSPGITLMSDVGSKEPIVFDSSLAELNERCKFTLFLYITGALDEKYVSRSHRRYLDDLIYDYKIYRNSGEMVECSHPGGPCEVGSRKVFVDIHGNLYPCERVGETEAMRIGTIYTGYDVEKAKSLTNIGSLTPEECKHCWAFSYCDVCVGFCIEGDRVSREKKLSRCSTVRSSVLNKLQDLQFLLDWGVDFEKGKELLRSK